VVVQGYNLFQNPPEFSAGALSLVELLNAGALSLVELLNAGGAYIFPHFWFYSRHVRTLAYKVLDGG
jgi:hypothetical protein